MKTNKIRTVQYRQTSNTKPKNKRADNTKQRKLKSGSEIRYFVKGHHWEVVN
jgi:hypothetical protein